MEQVGILFYGGIILICLKCGKKIDENEKFCSNCGNKILYLDKNEETINSTENNVHNKNNENKKGSNKKIYIICSIVALVFVVIAGLQILNGIKNKKLSNGAKEDSVLGTLNVKRNEGSQKKEDASKFPKQVDIKVSQINTDNFPLIKVYFSVVDNNENKLNEIDSKYFKIGEKFGNESYTGKDIISDLKFLSENEAINLNLVMDVSGSMDGNKMDYAKNSANDFLDIVNYNAGDKIEIISFNDGVEISQNFINDKELLKSCIYNLESYGSTAFYDSIYTALVETNKQFGNKCIISFTDGIDNRSKYSENDIINLSKQLSIPIYIIGVGNEVETEKLQNLAIETGGDYKFISDINDIGDIYKEIFKNQKSQYVLTYTSKNHEVSNNWRNINLSLNSDKYISTVDAQFIPKHAIEVDYSGINVNNPHKNETIKLDNNLKEELMNTISKYNSYWFAAMANKNVDLIVNATEKEKDRTNVLIENMKKNNKSYIGYIIKIIFDLDSVKLEQENNQCIAYISGSEQFKDIYYTGINAEPLPNRTYWRYKLIYDENQKIWLVDYHTALDSFNPVNKREF